MVDGNHKYYPIKNSWSQLPNKSALLLSYWHSSVPTLPLTPGPLTLRSISPFFCTGRYVTLNPSISKALQESSTHLCSCKINLTSTGPGPSEIINGLCQTWIPIGNSLFVLWLYGSSLTCRIEHNPWLLYCWTLLHRL